MLSTAVKTVVFAGLQSCGVNALNRRRSSDRLLTLCYHSVIPQVQPHERYRCRNAVSVREFRAHLEILRKRFTPVSADQVANWLSDGIELPPRPVLISFDDGYRNNLTHAAAELNRFGFPAIVFVATGFIDGKRLLWTQELDELVLQWEAERLPLPDGGEVLMRGEHASRDELAERIRQSCKRLSVDRRQSYLEMLRSEGRLSLQQWQRELYEFMTWDEVRELAGRGFAVGSHTVNHPILAQLGPEELDRELQDSKAAVERQLGRPCRWIAYPNGSRSDVSAAVFAAASRAGYEVGFPLFGGFSDRNPVPHVIDRAAIGGGESILRFHAIISGTLHRLQSALPGLRD